MEKEREKKHVPQLSYFILENCKYITDASQITDLQLQSPFLPLLVNFMPVKISETENRRRAIT